MLKKEFKNILGIVAEYNPFHNGHKYQIEYCKKIGKADVVVAVMSGNFSQRGEPAILDKWNRAEMALKNGVDLVIELPFYYSCNGSSIFAEGAMKTLSFIGCVNNMCFGIEGKVYEKIIEVSNLLKEETNEFSTFIKERIKNGESYPRTVEKAVIASLGDEYAGLFTPNNLLAMEYLKYTELFEKRNSANTIGNIEKNFLNIVHIDRNNVDHNSTNIDDDKEFNSGKSIRKILESKRFQRIYTFHNRSEIEVKRLCDMLKVPLETGEILLGNSEDLNGDRHKNLYSILQYKLMCESLGKSQSKSVSEGMENLFKKHIRNSSSEEFINHVTCKRYTSARIRRATIHFILGIENDYSQDEYVRILGFTDNGARLLKQIKKDKSNSAPIVTNVNKHRDERANIEEKVDLSIDIKATDLYNLISGRDLYKNSDFVKKPVIITHQH